MRWTFTAVSSFRLLLTLLLGLGLTTRPGLVHAQATGQGLVADSTELRALRAFYRSTQGDHWFNRTNWPATDSAWARTTMAQVATWAGVATANGDVTVLDFFNNGLGGTLPPEIGLLGGLQYLHIERNHISGPQFPVLGGTLPKELGQLQHLTALSIGCEGISGSIPPELGNLHALQYLDLGNDHLSGVIPPELANLAQLVHLGLDNYYRVGQIFERYGNLFSGPLPPELGRLSNLTSLGIGMGPHTGTLPKEWGQLRKLELLAVDDASLSGVVPDEILRLPNLTSLALGDFSYGYSNPNSFTKLPNPAIVPNLSALNLNLRFNHFGFGVLEPYFDSPGHMRTASTSLYLPQYQTLRPTDTLRVLVQQSARLRVSNDTALIAPHSHYQWQRQDDAGQWQALSGATDSTLVLSSARLADAGLYRCQATNEWVTGLTLYSRSTYLAVRDSDEGHVPNAVELHALHALYQSTNGAQWSTHTNWPATDEAWHNATLADAATWSGVVVQDRDVVGLYLMNNQLQGPLPSALGDLRWLSYAYLMNNQLTGPLPTSLGQLGRVNQLYFSYNQLTGQLPASLGQLTQLTQLGLDHNQLTGTLPASLGQLTGLQALYGQANQLTGSFPAFLLGCTSLRQLYLGENRFSGPLPTAWRQLTQLTQLGLNQSQYTGPVPADLLQLPLASLYLQSNGFAGLPSWVGAAQVPGAFYVNDNALDFAALEANFTGPGQPLPTFSYVPQVLPARPDTIQLTRGTAGQLRGRIGGANNQYQWQRQVVNSSQWVDLPGQTQPELRWDAVLVTDAGLYRTRVTNTWVTDVTLYGPPHLLRVVPDRGLTRNLPDDTNRGITTPIPVDSAAWHSAARVDVNFVRSWHPRVALTDAARVPRAVVDSVSMSTQYLDGLGRPVQTVLKQASPARRDLVQPQAYDGLGREPRQYLPYPDSVNGRGGYRPQALRQQDGFYRPSTGVDPPAFTDPTRGVARTGAAYAETRFEASPLNRVLAQGAAGEAWQPTPTGHYQQRLERPNAAGTDSVLFFQPGYDPRRLDPGYQGLYAAGELWGTQTTDEHGFRSIEWQDKLGQVVQKQVEAARLDTLGGTQARRWLRTGYVYDDFGHLRFVLQPEATRRVLHTGGQPASLPAGAAPFVFHYRYDGRGRQVAKQVPGQDGETLVVYDQLDRPVLSQDAQQRTRREWSWTKYDALGRIILSGLTTRQDTLGQVSLQALATADTATAHQYEQRTADGTRYPQYVTTDHAFPQLGQNGFSLGQVLNATYYDDYNFDNDAQSLADASYDLSTDAQFPSGAAPVADAVRTTNMTTRTLTRVLGVAENDLTQAAWLTTTTFYDERARPVQVQTTNARKGLDLLTTQLDFTGKVVQSVAVHQGPNHLPVQVVEGFTYDHTGRLLRTRQQLPGEARAMLLDSVHYNEIGQATRKTLATGRLQQDVDYAYNIRGWLTRLNDPYQPNGQDLFNLSLHYERGFTRGYEQYNGNLTGQTWRGRDGVQRAYGYVYDPLNRTLQGDFVARAGGSLGTLTSATAWNQEQDNYRLSFVSYDDNGNIQTLRRQGLLKNATHATSKQYGAVDNLTYAYLGNRLQAVDDAVTGNQLAKPATYHGAPTSLAGDFQEAGVHRSQEYTYDANGNLTQDLNKGITGILYNHINLPRQIHFGQVGDSVVFRYTASGQKVAKLVYQTGKPLLRTDYLGPYQYEQDSLKFFPHVEGRVLRFVSYDAANQPTVSYQREFTFKDHLGNLRLAYRAGQVRTYSATLEQTAYTHRRESQQFDSLSVSEPIAVQTSYTHGAGSWAARLNARNAGGGAPQPLGPLTQLAVQKGDKLSVTAPGFYPQQVSNSSFGFSLLSFVTGLLQPPAPGTPSGLDGSRRGGLPLLQIGLGAGLATLPQLSGGVPKGYLRVLVFNQDSALVDQHTVQLTQAALGSYQELHLDSLAIQQDGYVTVYVGNESPVDVYFDDVTIQHRQGLQVQENQYDPYGLDLAGISSAAPGLRLKNYYQFNGKENQLDLGLNWNHHDARFFDYTLGRWHVVDPMVEDGQENWTPYAFSYDNAVRFNDPDGNCPTCPAAAAGAVIGAIIGGGIEAGMQMYRNGGHVSDWHAVGGAALQGGVTGGLAGLTAGASLARSGAVGAISNVAGGVAKNIYDGKPVTVGSVAKDAAIGAAAGIGGHLAGKAVGAIANRLKGGAAAAEAEAGAGANAAKTACGCFTAGTGVSTRMGRKPIEQVQVGDSVWAYNERTHSTALRPVTHLFRYERDTVYVLHTATGEALRTTSDHPFYVRGQWVRVKRLRVGDSLVSQSGQRHVLRRIDLKPEHVTVYNFTVDELHTYFVGQNAILVHNSGPCPGAGGGSAAQPKSTRFVAEADGTVHDVKPTMDRISSGGRNPHRNDGSVFKNRGGDLPIQPQGHYREYVHPTPGANGPGAMRVVTGQDDKAWFTPDHYKTFTPIR